MTNENINKISAYLLAYLRDKTSQEGMSQNKYAKITGVKQGTINGFLNTSDKRPRPISGASLDLVLRLFPELQRPILSYLESRRSGIQQVANGNILSTITQTAGVPSRLEDCRQAAIDEIINMDIPDDIRTKVLRVLSKTLQ